jgi:ATP-binding cassette subfamily B (MDR/TAP) protein 1
MGMVYIAIFSLIACVSLALAIGWKLTLVAMCAALPITMTAGYFRLRYEIQFEKMNAAVFAESSKFAAEAFGAVRTVASLTLEELICDRYSLLLHNHVVSAERKARYSTFIFALSDSVNLLCMALTFWYGGRLIASYEYDSKQWLIIYTAIINGSESAGQWMSFGPNIAQASAAANRILSLRETQNQIAAQPITEILEGSGGVSIDFQDVYFTYPTRDIPIFAGLNMNIKKGQFAALVGASGCGKSTIISLLEQFYRVHSGSITIDGINIASLDIKKYRKLFSLVAQEATLFQGTLRENILLGVDDNGSVTDENIYKACRDAEIHDFIMSLPDGYSTDIGSKGIALSGGQKQRIAIARALIRDPQVMLLDEATSSLDSESEKLIQAALEKAAKHRTTIAVAHRYERYMFVLGLSLRS